MDGEPIMMITNKSIEKHINHDVVTKRADVKGPHYGYYHCLTCRKFVTWIPKEIYWAEQNKQKREQIMWFGKYQGMPLCDVPQEYLEWAIMNVDRGVRKLVQEYERRQNE